MLRQAIENLWTGEISKKEFIAIMTEIIETYGRLAWLEGAAEVGIDEADISEEENAESLLVLAALLEFLPSFADHVVENSKAKGGLFDKLWARGKLWVRQYARLKMHAMVFLKPGQRFIWRLGIAEHCTSCLKLESKVKLGKVWRKLGILPRVPGAWYLVCKGYYCACALVPVDLPVSPGPLPSLP